MILVMMLLASTAYASSGSISIDVVGSRMGNADISGGAGTVNMDVVGSLMGNANIISHGKVSADVELVGSSAGDINITSEVHKHKSSSCCDMWCNFNRPLCYPYSSYIPSRYCQSNCYPYNYSQHFGVDAWHGCYWYSPIYLPKWPQL
ncbi:MAG: hypothetical protein ACE14P_08200 [Methanotrichaceae archaeon]